MALLTRVRRTAKYWGELLLFRRPQLACPRQMLGSDYGGYCVYPADLSPKSVAYCFGVGRDLSFELGLIERFGLTVHGFDPTPGSVAWVERQSLPERYCFHPWGVAARDGLAAFRPPDDPSHISHTMLDSAAAEDRSVQLPVKRIGTIARELGHERIDILKMDIEGAEYEVIDDLLGSGLHVAQILIEFHHQFDGVPLRRTLRAVRRLNRAGYRSFHISQRRREFSFLRTDRGPGQAGG
jgi:FkbM family methyltransferase